MKFTRQQSEWIADNASEYFGWPSDLQDFADKLAETNPAFDKERFLRRATKNWESKHPIEMLDDSCDDAAWITTF